MGCSAPNLRPSSHLSAPILSSELISLVTEQEIMHSLHNGNKKPSTNRLWLKTTGLVAACRWRAGAQEAMLGSESWWFTFCSHALATNLCASTEWSSGRGAPNSPREQPGIRQEAERQTNDEMKTKQIERVTRRRGNSWMGFSSDGLAEGKRRMKRSDLQLLVVRAVQGKEREPAETPPPEAVPAGSRARGFAHRGRWAQLSPWPLGRHQVLPAGCSEALRDGLRLLPSARTQRAREVSSLPGFLPHGADGERSVEEAQGAWLLWLALLRVTSNCFLQGRALHSRLCVPAFCGLSLYNPAF
ncbi:uncharacterized protein ACIB01_002582 isoform 1-T1 [Guaruba guarouba]